MCEICKRSPCPPGCPNADSPAAIAYCAECGELIFAGDPDSYKDGYGYYYCSQQCALKYLQVEPLSKTTSWGD